MRDQEGVSAEKAADYRLPTNVIPQRYEIRLTPDLKSFTFDGDETISVAVREPVTEVWLNALELEIKSASAERNGIRLPATPELDPKQERVKFAFAQALEPGDWLLSISFKGILNDKLHGFYRSQYEDASGKNHLVATTQFEATDARRAFPCWDEPELKAVYKVTLVIDNDLTAVSNTAVESERKLEDGKKEITFKDTMKMSTYLVAFAVGEFDFTEVVDAGTPLRVVHVPGKSNLTGWAKQIGAFSLKFFADYYGIPYPGDKLDLIAIPDFAAGAMENLGAITFRETALLVDEKSASRAELERVADVVSHENAHMWFGDLVTMKWWNGIWLNEAFATFMEMLAVDAWKPQWKRWESFSVSRTAAMTVDGLASTRPIEFTVRGPEDARAMFDVLTYEKGAATLRMLEQYLGPDKFRDGIRLYLRKHQYANAETSDLWDALEQASQLPVRKVMDSWIFQPGFPIIEAATAPGGKGLTLRQRRFFYLPQDKENDQLWQAPVMIRAKTDQGISSHKVLLGEKETTVELPGRVDWALINEGGHGFYRARYSPELLGALTANLGELAPIERFALVNDTWAAVLGGLAPLADFTRMVRMLGGETDLNVWRAVAGALNYLELIVEESARPQLAALVREVMGPVHERLGWSSRDGEDELSGQLRGTVLGMLGTVGDDPRVQARARELYDLYQRDASQVDRNIVPALVTIAAHTGDSALYQQFKQNFKQARTPQDEQRYLFALTSFRDPALLQQTMGMTLDGQVRTQNAPYLMHSLMLNTVSRYQAWDFVRSNWETMCDRFPDNALPRMCEAISALLDRHQEVRDFFAVHRVRLGGKIIDQHLERLAVAVALRQREGANISAALKG